MKKRSLARLLVVFAVFIGLAACRHMHGVAESSSEQEATNMLRVFLVGSYEVVGRYPDSQQLYSGTVEIRLSDTDSKTLSMKRMIGDVSTQAEGTIAEATSDGVKVLRCVFQDAGQSMEATYLIDSDLDNYARLTGYVYRRGGNTRLPGIEVLFNNHYRNDG